MLCHHTQVRDCRLAAQITLTGASNCILLANMDSGGPEVVGFQHRDRIRLPELLANKVLTDAGVQDRHRLSDLRQLRLMTHLGQVDTARYTLRGTDGEMKCYSVIASEEWVRLIRNRSDSGRTCKYLFTVAASRNKSPRTNSGLDVSFS